MAQEYKDYVFANGGIEGQVTPTAVSQPGALSTAGLVIVTAQISSQSNPFVGANSIILAEQALAVAGPVYSAAGSRSAV
jgi:hypothetical protein